MISFVLGMKHDMQYERERGYECVGVVGWVNELILYVDTFGSSSSSFPYPLCVIEQKKEPSTNWWKRRPRHFSSASIGLSLTELTYSA